MPPVQYVRAVNEADITGGRIPAHERRLLRKAKATGRQSESRLIGSLIKDMIGKINAT